MPRFAANLSMLFTDRPFLDRFEAAARAGFEAVEILFPYAFGAQEIRSRLDANGLKLVLFNLPPGDTQRGERGLACLPGREEEFRRSVGQALAYADALGCPQMHCMAGLAPSNPDASALQAIYLSNLRWAADEFEAAGRSLLIEPINRRDIPGYFLNNTVQARQVIEATAKPNVRLQLDLYHCQISEGDVANRIRANADIVAHIQIASVPDRQEPDHGELHYPYLFDVIDATGYTGFLGCEYRPAGRTEDGLGWLAPHLVARAPSG